MLSLTTRSYQQQTALQKAHTAATWDALMGNCLQDQDWKPWALPLDRKWGAGVVQGKEGGKDKEEKQEQQFTSRDLNFCLLNPFY